MLAGHECQGKAMSDPCRDTTVVKRYLHTDCALQTALLPATGAWCKRGTVGITISSLAKLHAGVMGHLAVTEAPDLPQLGSIYNGWFNHADVVSFQQ